MTDMTSQNSTPHKYLQSGWRKRMNKKKKGKIQFNASVIQENFIIQFNFEIDIFYF